MGGIQKLLVVIIGIAALIPVGINLLIGVDTSAWDPSIAAIWDVLPIIIIVVILGILLTIGGRKGGLFAIVPVWAIPGFNAEIFAGALLIAAISWTAYRIRRERKREIGSYRTVA